MRSCPVLPNPVPKYIWGDLFGGTKQVLTIMQRWHAARARAEFLRFQSMPVRFLNEEGRNGLRFTDQRWDRSAVASCRAETATPLTSISARAVRRLSPPSRWSRAAVHRAVSTSCAAALSITSAHPARVVGSFLRSSLSGRWSRLCAVDIPPVVRPTRGVPQYFHSQPLPRLLLFLCAVSPKPGRGSL